MENISLEEKKSLYGAGWWLVGTIVPAAVIGVCFPASRLFVLLVLVFSQAAMLEFFRKPVIAKAYPGNGNYVKIASSLGYDCVIFVIVALMVLKPYLYFFGLMSFGGTVGFTILAVSKKK
ncbi:hypothetical protein COT75_04165 [Candidatus Beckwithbacteria bacterium CG10_big_fil_rev_8_21_14_0_10_34_10]|uniref:Uncharacterized protein n=1 Tax=Candidatus Beckwithbacteria bacterium CG10_big_fil_rev_8_21_14_0_10_34_10 TaxID=1974495 RepID=A0A2H0W8F9_9BACT|nr:MAG: hypothetical protein COT75_04165 [Candidatus Beckwithbacteria bacterium CG10_big_fil_rev_8_21_14_0_10_34_10]